MLPAASAAFSWVLPREAPDPVQSAGEACFEHVMPDATSAIDALAGLEAVDSDDELHVVNRPVADRWIEPSVEAVPGDAQHLAHPADRSDVKLPREESERHATSRAKNAAAVS